MNKIFEVRFGSKLYGTSLPTSDDDRKGIFIADYKDIILKKDQETIQQIDKATGIDWEFKELRRFIWDVMKGQTYALEMVFSPPSMWIPYAADLSIWNEIVANREKLLSRNVMPFIGFAIGQAHKYSLKGARYNDLEKIITFLENLGEKRLMVASLENSELLKINSAKLTLDASKTPVLEVMGKQFQNNTSISDVLTALLKLKDRYGDRAHTAAEAGEVDWKAYGHSVRLLEEVMELMDTGKITLPRPNASFLVDVRLGKVPYETVTAWIGKNIEIAKERIKTSNLPENPDQDFWNDWLLEKYR